MSDIAVFAYAGATLVAESSGAPGSPTYVMIHGIGMGRSIFADLVAQLTEPLTAHDDDTTRAMPPAYTIALDLPGYGEAPEPRRVLTMERTADLVAEFLRSRALGPCVIIGHSMGTQIAVEIAARHPEVVERVVLIAPTVNRRERTAVQQALRLAQDLALESPRVIFIGAREYVRAGPRLRAKLRAMLVHRPEETYPRVAVPALVLRGETDYVCPRAWCRFVTESLPDARLAEVIGHGHETMIRNAAPAVALIREFVAEG
ncbi:MAG: alpha/beta fold hydrolase [Microbacterium sp.]